MADPRIQFDDDAIQHAHGVDGGGGGGGGASGGVYTLRSRSITGAKPDRVVADDDSEANMIDPRDIKTKQVRTRLECRSKVNVGSCFPAGS
jgi:hypothetical protein